VVKVILQKGRIVAAHERYNSIRQVAPVCTPPNTCSLGHRSPQPKRHLDRFGSAIFAQLTAECRRACPGMFFPLKFVPGYLDPI